MLKPERTLKGVRIASIEDIACMKLVAISRRGAKRDFIDLYFIAQHVGLGELLTLYERKYAEIRYNLVHLKKSLVFFDDAEGVPMPDMPNTEASFAELKARLARTIDFVKGFKPAQIDGTEDKEITIKLGANERKFTGQGLLLNFILPNFYFHCSTAYDILRHCGIELAKRDFMSTPVNL